MIEKVDDRKNALRYNESLHSLVTVCLPVVIIGEEMWMSYRIVGKC